MRGLFLVVRKSLRQHAVSTGITAASVALACGLVMAVFTVDVQTQKAFTTEPGFDAVLGAKGSRLQLVLNTVFHLETSPGNIPWELYTTLREDPRISLAIPYAVGDNYQGYRIVGTTEEVFTRFELREGEKFEFAGGRAFNPLKREAVIGSTVALRTGLRVGSKMHAYHGTEFDASQKHEGEYTVVGVMEPTNTPSDKVVWIPIEGVFRMPGHSLWGSGKRYIPEKSIEIPDEHKEISAVMLKFDNPQYGMTLAQQINRQGKVATLAWPIAAIMIELFDKLGWMHIVLRFVAYLVVVVAAASILASLYNTMHERRREFAILRSLGARRSTVSCIMVLESTVIAALGSLLGFGVYAGVLAGTASLIREETGVTLNLLEFHAIHYQAPLGMILLGAVAGVIPALKAYRTDVASNLTATS